MSCDIEKLRHLASAVLRGTPDSPVPASPELMLGDERLAYEALEAIREIDRLSCKTTDGKRYGPGSKVYYVDPVGHVQGLYVVVSFRDDSSRPEPVYCPYPVYSTPDAAAGAVDSHRGGEAAN